MHDCRQVVTGGHSPGTTAFCVLREKRPVKHVIARVWFDEEGQDLIEYALLASCIGFAAVVGVALLGSAMTTTYQSWDNAVQSDALVDTPVNPK